MFWRTKYFLVKGKIDENTISLIAAGEIVKQLFELHSQDERGFCKGCLGIWPCNSITRIVNGLR